MSRIFAVAAAIVFGLTIGLLSTPSAARVGQQCGGFFPITCGPNEFCQLPTGVCFAPDFRGQCAAVPRFCPHFVRPVCGCNGVTYNNDCERERAQVSKRHNGRC